MRVVTCASPGGAVRSAAPRGWAAPRHRATAATRAAGGAGRSFAPLAPALPTGALPAVRCQASSGSSAAAAAPATGTHAVVIGAGLAGLTAAKALAPHFERVTVLERDAWTANVAEGTDHRPGVPQFQQPHVLLARGLQALDTMFGDFRGRLRAAGGEPVCFTNDFEMYDYQIDFKRGESEVRGVLGTRALIEQTARSMLLEQEPSVQLRSAAPVAGLVFEGAGSGGKPRVAGVKLKGGEVLPSDLVVDASGRSSRTSEWMAEAGLQPPPELIVDAKLGYATRFYERPADYSGPLAALVGGRPMYTRGAVLIPVEGNRWQLILGGYAGDHPPTDEEGFAAFMQSLESPCVAEKLQGAKPLTPVSRYLGTRNLRRCYEKVDMPGRLAVLGDATAAFNPIYGQGITTGVLQSEALKEVLEEQVQAAGGDLAAALAGLPNAFQKRAAAVVETPWTLAISEDTKWPIAESNYQVPQTAALLRPYFAALAVAASQDHEVFAEWARVLHMLKPPTAFFSPFMLLKTLQYAVLLPFLRRLPLVGRLLPGGAPAAPASP